MLRIQAKIQALLVTPGARPHLRHQDAQHHHKCRRGEASHHDRCSSVYSTELTGMINSLSEIYLRLCLEVWMDQVLVDSLPGKK